LDENEESNLVQKYAIEARRLSVVRGRRLVLQEIDLAISPGEIVALRGANGTGKTTLVHCLVGVLAPTAGEVLWFNEPAGRSCAARRLVGFLGHELGLYLALTPWENLLLTARLYGLADPADRVAELLTCLILKSHAQRRTSELSRGMRQRLGIARALIHDPPILILDEPFTGLDAASTCLVVELLQALREKQRAILLSGHDAPGDENLANRSIILHGGQLVSGVTCQPVMWAGQYARAGRAL
jgi:heme ABC exporter ATP-binding subunit CcmA